MTVHLDSAIRNAKRFGDLLDLEMLIMIEDEGFSLLVGKLFERFCNDCVDLGSCGLLYQVTT